MVGGGRGRVRRREHRALGIQRQARGLRAAALAREQAGRRAHGGAASCPSGARGMRGAAALRTAEHAGRGSSLHCRASGALLTLHCGMQLAGFSVRGESPVYHPTCLGVPSGQSESLPAVEHTFASAV